MEYLSWEKALEECTKVESLKLTDSEINKMDERIKDFINLKILILNNTKWIIYPPDGEMIADTSAFINLPEEIGRLERLEELVLVNLFVDSLPESIVRLKELKFLKVAFSERADFSKEISKLKMMRRLDALDVSESKIKPHQLDSLKTELPHLSEIIYEPS